MRLPTENPYDFSHAVRDPDVFAGRSAELRDIDYYLQQAQTSAQPIGLAIIGKRTSGKTSLLNMIESKARQSNLFPVRIDLDESDAETPLLFFHRLIEETLLAAFEAGHFGGMGGDAHRAYISATLEALPTFFPLMFPIQFTKAVRDNLLNLPISAGIIVADLQTIRREVGQPIVLLLDEADVIARQPTVLQKLRNVLMRTDGIQIVIAGTEVLFPEFDRVFAPIARQFKSVMLDAFHDPRDTADCVLLPLRKAGLDPAAVLDRETYDDLTSIHEVARGRPYEVKLLCHFMFKRVQEGVAKKMVLDLPVLEEVRTQLESERNVGQRPILNAIRALDVEALEALAILVDCDGGASFEDIWAAEYAFHGSARISQERLRQRLEQFVEAGILRLDNTRITFRGDDFDRLYTTYFARERQVEFAFPPAVGIPLDLYWSVNLRWWFRAQSVYPIGQSRSGESRRDIDSIALAELLNVLSGVTDNPGLLERNEELTVDLHNLIVQLRGLDEARIRRVRIRIASVDVSALFTGPGILDDAGRAKVDEEMRLVQIRVRELGGSLESEDFMLPIYNLNDITKTIASRGSVRLRTKLARTHAGMARQLYKGAATSHESLIHAMLVPAYGADVFPSMANDVGYIFLATGEPRAAMSMLNQALRASEGDIRTEALVNFNLAIAEAQTGDFRGAIDRLNRAQELAQDLDEEDRAMLCLLVGSVKDGRLKFEEAEKPDLLVAIVNTKEAIDHQLPGITQSNH